MTKLTEGRHPAEFILSEAAGMRSRDNITILSGEGVLEPGTLVGKIDGDTGGVGTVTVGAAVPGAGNTVGSGAVTLADPAYGAGVKEGTYKLLCIEPGSNAGKFSLEDPDGVTIDVVTVAVAYDGVLKFTIADATDFVAGDSFTIPVSIADAASASKWKAADPTSTDGSQGATGVILYGVDATSADVKVAAIVRDAEVNQHELVYDASNDDAPKKAAQRASLATVGIIAR